MEHFMEHLCATIERVRVKRMNYGEMSKEIREQRELVWKQHLRAFCPMIDEETENHPCDNGVLCDKCAYDYGLNLSYVLDLWQHNIPITDEEAEKFSKEIAEFKVKRSKEMQTRMTFHED
jgi:hypothetical protein